MTPGKKWQCWRWGNHGTVLCFVGWSGCSGARQSLSAFTWRQCRFPQEKASAPVGLLWDLAGGRLGETRTPQVRPALAHSFSSLSGRAHPVTQQVSEKGPTHCAEATSQEPLVSTTHDGGGGECSRRQGTVVTELCMKSFKAFHVVPHLQDFASANRAPAGSVGRMGSWVRDHRGQRVGAHQSSALWGVHGVFAAMRWQHCNFYNEPEGSGSGRRPDAAPGTGV